MFKGYIQCKNKIFLISGAAFLKAQKKFTDGEEIIKKADKKRKRAYYYKRIDLRLY
jgi:hypothetical protein